MDREQWTLNKGNPLWQVRIANRKLFRNVSGIESASCLFSCRGGFCGSVSNFLTNLRRQYAGKISLVLCLSRFIVELGDESWLGIDGEFPELRSCDRVRHRLEPLGIGRRNADAADTLNRGSFAALRNTGAGMQRGSRTRTWRPVAQRGKARRGSRRRYGLRRSSSGLCPASSSRRRGCSWPSICPRQRDRSTRPWDQRPRHRRCCPRPGFRGP